ncbi:cytokine-inducible SH2-containing protein-like [Arapaima gigas]
MVLHFEREILPGFPTFTGDPTMPGDHQWYQQSQCPPADPAYPMFPSNPSSPCSPGVEAFPVSTSSSRVPHVYQQSQHCQYVEAGPVYEVFTSSSSIPCWPGVEEFPVLTGSPSVPQVYQESQHCQCFEQTPACPVSTRCPSILCVCQNCQGVVAVPVIEAYLGYPANPNDTVKDMAVSTQMKTGEDLGSGTDLDDDDNSDDPPDTVCDIRNDLPCLVQNFWQLCISGWYWGALPPNQARMLLKDAPEGTFLVRDSTHWKYSLTLTVKAAHGPSNVHIKYRQGRFRLASSSLAVPHLLSFTSVPELVQHYTTLDSPTKDEHTVSGILESIEDRALRLVKPLRVSNSFPSLQHLARLAINSCTCCHEQLPLSRPLVDYLQQYPFIL